MMIETPITPMPPLQTKEEKEDTIRLIASIQESIIYLQHRLKKMDKYVDKYFPNDENNQNDTKVRRVV